MHDPASGCWFVNTRTKASGPATKYSQSNPAAYYSQLSPRLTLENRSVDSNGFVLPGPSGASAAQQDSRVAVSPVVLEGVVGQHVSVAVNGSFDDAEEIRRRDLELALKEAIPGVRDIMQQGERRCYNIGIIYNFLLSGEMKNGQRAEERADGGIYKKVASVRCWPKSNLKALFRRSAKDVVAEMVNRVDEGGDSIFYGVSHWRLLRVNISVSPVAQGGKGGNAYEILKQQTFPLAEFLKKQKRNTLLYSPPVDGGCFLHCIARAKMPDSGPYPRNDRAMSYTALSRVVVPEEYDTDGMDVPCSEDIIRAFAVANNTTINVFTPADGGEESPFLLDPLILTPKTNEPIAHIDLLLYEEHWMLILNIGRLLYGWEARVSLPVCRFCLSVLNRTREKEGTTAHICNEDATTLSIKPARDDAFYSASNAMFAGRLPLSVAATLELRLYQMPEEDDTDDEISFAMDIYQSSEFQNGAVIEQLLLMKTGTLTSQLLRSLHYLAHKALGQSGIFRRYAKRFVKHKVWEGEPCAACGEVLTDKTAVYHHDHLYGNFIAWVCQRCNKAEALRDVIVVTRGLKSVIPLLLSAGNNLGVMRISHVGDWKDPLSLNISWREASSATRFGVRLISIEKLCNSATGELSRGSLEADVAHFRKMIWEWLHIEPLRFMTLPQIAEAACLTSGEHRIRLPYTPEQMRLLENPAGGLVFASKGVFTASRRTSIAEFDITKCFGALLREKVATDLSPTPCHFLPGEDWHSDAFCDTWIACALDTTKAWGLANVTLPERLQNGLPVPREVLLALEKCGVKIIPTTYFNVKYERTHTALIDALAKMHNACKARMDHAGAQIAKAMMVTSYGKLAQNDRAWPAQQVVMSERDTRLGCRQLLPSLRVELVKEASHELLNNVWELEPLLSSYPREEEFKGRKDIRVLCVEDLRKRLCAHPGIIVLRVFYRSYIVIECERHVLEEFLAGQQLEGAVAYEQRSDMGIEVITRASSRAKTASRPVYAGQDIAMRSWAKIFTFLQAAVSRFGRGNVVVIRIMVDCLTLYIRHAENADASACLRELPEAGDGVALGSWKDEFQNEKIDKWFQLNKTGYEVRYHSLRTGEHQVKRRLGGIPKADRDALPPWTFDAIMTDGETVEVKTSRGPMLLSLK